MPSCKPMVIITISTMMVAYKWALSHTAQSDQYRVRGDVCTNGPEDKHGHYTENVNYQKGASLPLGSAAMNCKLRQQFYAYSWHFGLGQANFDKKPTRSNYFPAAGPCLE